ncbi:hypothetical protein BKA70DRAFT_1476014 [Coprinopsis sp. MPI-PUGE-AT-0042]|nr:hypothetical protein BKA70DRAFT_1476014 [Coprinopsis sp. MPI-PUGE-AT-0042]
MRCESKEILVSEKESQFSTRRFRMHSNIHLWWAIGQEGLLERIRLTNRESSLLATLLSDVSIRSADVSVVAGVVEEPATKSKVLGMVMMGKGKNERTRNRLRRDQRLNHQQRFPFHISTSTTSPFVIVSHPPSFPFLDFLCKSYRRLRIHVQHSCHRATHPSTTHRNSVTRPLFATGSHDDPHTRTCSPGVFGQPEDAKDEWPLSALITLQRRTTSPRRLSWTSYECEAGISRLVRSSLFLSSSSFNIGANALVIGMAFYTGIVGPKFRLVCAPRTLRVDALCKGSDERRNRQGGTGGGFSSHSSASEGRGFVGLDSASGGGGGDGVNNPFFELLEQLGSLVKGEAFPALKYVHDRSPQSRVMRETGRAKVWDVEMRSVGSFAGSWWDDGP